MMINSSGDPVATWSAPDGSILEGPDAFISVDWTEGDNTIINNSLEFQVGFVIYNQTGEFSDINETNVYSIPDHVYQAYLPAGYYFFELTWNHRGTDLDGFIYTDPELENEVSVSMATWSFPETSNARLPYSGDYWIVVDWYNVFSDNFVPINYQFFIGSDDYFLYENSTNGSFQMFNTETIPDNTYQVTSICYDSKGNRFTDTRTYTTHNQFPPYLDWISVNDISENGTEIVRGTDTVFKWSASDVNEKDTVFYDLYYKKPGVYVYSTAFSAWIITNYEINWNLSIFSQDGLYHFKLESYNLNEQKSNAIYFYFYVITKASSKATTNKIDLTNSYIYETPSFTFFTTKLIFTIVTLIRFRKKRRH
ncbi:MAG: hypothetical protein ACXAEU_05515 [Candidatus Hodarchaeales archaeon]